MPTSVDLYMGQEHDCNYIDGEVARSLFLDPNIAPDSALYSALVENGFRRSGEFVYRPQCRHCGACLPLRIDAHAFVPDRSDRRTWHRNADLKVLECTPRFTDEYFELYRRYQSGRHPGGGMDDPTKEQFLAFLDAPWSPTRFVEFREGDRLLSVAVVDRLRHGLSAVYTFFDPEERRRRLGSQAVLWELEMCRRQGLRWLFLGYWIEDSPKMGYKARFRPAETFIEGRWRPLESAVAPEPSVPPSSDPESSDPEPLGPALPP